MEIKKAHTIGYLFCDICKCVKLHEKGNIINDGVLVGTFTECLKCKKIKEVRNEKR